MSYFDADTTLKQLTQSNNGWGRLKAMIGAKHPIFSTEKAYISFKFMSGAKNKANQLKIILDSNDTYTMEFGKVWGGKFRVIKTIEGVYNDMLKDIFESETKLYLSF